MLPRTVFRRAARIDVQLHNHDRGAAVFGNQETARKLATEAIASCPREEHFLPLLDDLLERQAPPDDLDRVIATAQALGVPEEEVYDRLGKALEQLRLMVLGDMTDPDRYQRLVQRISSMPREMMKQLAQRAADTGNFEAMGEKADAQVSAVADRIRHCHFKDFVPAPDSPSGRRGCDLGTGMVPNAEVAKLLTERGYDGWVALETIGRAEVSPVEAVARELPILRSWFAA